MTSLTKSKARAMPLKPAGNSNDSHKRVVAAARSAVRRALKAHKAAGASVVVWKNGKVVRIPASKLSD